MKYAAIALALLLGLAWAQEEEPEAGKPEAEQGEGEGEEGGEGEEAAKPPPVAPPSDPARVLSDLTLANAAKDVPRIDTAAKETLAWAAGAKDEAMAESLAKELGESLKAAKGNQGTLKVCMEALGELRSKSGGKILKKYAHQKKVKNEDEEKLQALAIVGLGKLADPKEIEGFGEISKSESTIVAKAAYEALGFYGPAKGKVRRQCAEVLMKRLDMEYPSSGGQGGKSVSAEKQERWTELSPAIVASMKAICREPTINDIDNWREWWRENKKETRIWKDDEEEKS